jgi:hypothetical protein
MSAEIEVLEDVQHLQGRETLTVGRQLPHRGPTIGGRDGLDPLTAVIGEIVHREEATVLLGERDDPARDLALVARAPAAFGDEPQRPRQRRVGEDLALAGRPALGQEDLGESG